MRKLTCLIGLLIGMGFGISVEASSRCVAEISLKDYQMVMKEHGPAIRDHVDRIGLDRERFSVDVLMTDDGRQILDEMGLSWTEVRSAEDVESNRDIDPQYYDYAEVMNVLNNLQTTYPSIVKRYELAVTAENRTVWAVKISDNVLVQEEEPEVLVLGLHEAREIMSTEIAMDMAIYLAENYGSNPDVTNWVNSWQIWIVPMLNPDGSAYCWSTDQYWIKNRRELGGDVFGVALGHNYDVDWGACFGSSSDPNSSGYRGTAPGSEPEIQGIMTLAQNHAFTAVISYHSFNELIMYPYGCWGESAPEAGILSSFAGSMGAVIQREDGGYGYDSGAWWQILYNNDGNETDYFYAGFGSLAMAVEVNASSYYPAYSIRNTTVTRNRAGWQNVLDLYETGPIVQGTITDACTGQPVQATYYFEEYPLTPKESPRQNNPVTGFYTAVGHAGTLNLIVEADGYLSRRVPVLFGTGPITYDIGLLPTDEPGLAVWAVVIEDQAGDNDGQLDPGETAYLNMAIWAPGAPVSGITGILSTTDPYITITDNSAAWVDLPSGGGAYCPANRFRVTAAAGTPEYHQAYLTVTFSCDQTLCDPEDTTFVRVFSINYMCPFWEQNFNADPGWEITSYPTSGSPPGPYNNWEFGEPQVGPDGAYTGLYVYGTGLAGNYDNNWTLCLTSPPIDCSNVTEVALKFAQYYEVENSYDHARVRIRSDGGSWVTILDEDGSSGGWQWRELDISAWADDEPQVELRFDVRADSSISQAGHYIDDVWICGLAEGAGQVQPTPTLPPTSTPSPTPTSTSGCLHHGDVNADGEVTAGDAQTTFLIALGAYTPTQVEFCAADCNGDSEVTAGDAQGVFLTALGSSSCLDPLPRIMGRGIRKELAAEERTVTVGSVRPNGNQWNVEVRISDNHKPIDAFLIELAYDASCLRLIDAYPGDLDPGWVEFDSQELPGNRLRIGGYSVGTPDQAGIPSGSHGIIAHLVFDSIAGFSTLNRETPRIQVMALFDDVQ
ncbi:hypothetical protein JXA80_10225 [bacterium]|nr:hypothetical protein [candidate division CSSED10-310 bacterium]